MILDLPLDIERLLSLGKGVSLRLKISAISELD